MTSFCSSTMLSVEQKVEGTMNEKSSCSVPFIKSSRIAWILLSCSMREVTMKYCNIAIAGAETQWKVATPNVLCSFISALLGLLFPLIGTMT